MKIAGWIINLKRPGSLWGTELGWVLVCVGVLGLILPVIPGLPLLAAGLFVLSTRYRWAAVCLKCLKRKVKQISGRRLGRKGTAAPLVTSNRG